MNNREDTGNLSDNSSSSFEERESSLDLSVPHIERKEIENILGMRPKNLYYYRRAFVHKSIRRNVRKSKTNVLDYYKESNERLEFLGDSVLGLIVGDILFHKFPNKSEGFITRMKTKIVRREGCAKFARKLNFSEYIFTSDFIKIKKDTDKILEDTFEAFIGAIYKDLGFKHAFVFVKRLIDKYVDFDKLLIDNNYKDILMRYSQYKNYQLPIYNEVREEGPSNNRYFTMSASLIIEHNKKLTATGKDKSKRGAEQKAANNLMLLLDKNDLDKFSKRDLN